MIFFKKSFCDGDLNLWNPPKILEKGYCTAVATTTISFSFAGESIVGLFCARLLRRLVMPETFL